MKEIWKFRCENLAFHEYVCCPTCCNRYKDDGEKGMFSLDHHEEIEKARKDDFIKRAIAAGFSKKKAEFLMGVNH